ncbi:hypothetical protein COV24_01575 [candidate division WWE3 bacterium CG10_big_fil_rev_8_21_14_0_10_32_10]|uniref:Glucose-6-phosphate dehydrogenase (NADP(+)) n=1 Tax=candidate division WWE3 bacterium CG10_big_fil_rev_8_21_14_0_10_32_10 TaxID=1975090 RepID=A0A2H0RD29_UNCKA|nr:MAG: hypothetical protein COV24_01575 [candidate division WWE3 bacterium CG10_big_fil_rev_8_21_14_0_10_32_10]
MKSNFNIPTIIIVFGITGDLFKKKILKSLNILYTKKMLPEKFEIYGFGRRDWNDINIQEYIKTVSKEQNIICDKSFINKFHYAIGTFENIKSYIKLAAKIGYHDKMWSFCANKLFYLAVPPNDYEIIVNNLHKSKLTKPCGEKEGWTRVILEKPFGIGLRDAKKLDGLLKNLFKEEQIYRVDHYLAKETVRNILALRFSNSFLIPAWKSEYIESISVKIQEKDTLEKRGNFYDGVGALRDVGQNHALQLLALFTMTNPENLDSVNIRKKRAEPIKYLIPDINSIKRGQYIGYKKELGVNKKSTTETYFKLKSKFIDGPFKNTNVVLEAGKGLKENITEIIISFKHPYMCLCPPEKEYTNVLRYIIKPKEQIILEILVKKPGYKFEVQKQNFEFNYNDNINKKELIGDYEQLFMDIIKGDQTLFVSTQEVVNQWVFVEKILHAWTKKRIKLMKYKVGTNPY